MLENPQEFVTQKNRTIEQNDLEFLSNRLPQLWALVPEEY